MHIVCLIYFLKDKVEIVLQIPTSLCFCFQEISWKDRIWLELRLIQTDFGLHKFGLKITQSTYIYFEKKKGKIFFLNKFIIFL